MDTMTSKTDHTLTLYRDDNRMGSHYGEHYYVERMNGTTVKIEYLDWMAHDRGHAHEWAWSVAKLYGAQLVDRRPHPCLYGWSAD